MIETTGKRCLLYITGQIDHPFFYNEIEEIKKEFNEIYVFPYEEPEDSIHMALDRSGVKLIPILKERSYNIKKVIEFNKMSWVRREKEYIKKNVKKKIRAYIYLQYYLFFISKHLDSFESLINKLNYEGKMIYVYSFWASKGAVLAAVIRMRNRCVIKSLARAHRYDLYEEKNQICYLPFRILIADKLDNIYFISEDGLRYFKKQLLKRGMNYEKGKVIKLGTYEPNFRKRYTEKCKIVIASCSRIIEVKRLDLIIKLMKILLENTDACWIHLGTGNDSYETTIRSMADNCIPNKYIFLGDVENNKISEVYKKYDVDWFVNLSDSEGIPVSIMEAMSCGIPAVARDVGGNKEIVDDMNGIVISDITDENFKCIAGRIMETSQNKYRYLTLSQNAFEKWNKEYNTLNNTKLFLDEIL